MQQLAPQQSVEDKVEHGINGHKNVQNPTSAPTRKRNTTLISIRERNHTQTMARKVDTTIATRVSLATNTRKRKHILTMVLHMEILENLNTTLDLLQVSRRRP